MKRLPLLILLLATMIPIAPAYACSCAAPPSALEALAQASAVFTGRVVGIDTPAGYEPLRVDFEVETVWKGPVEAQVEIRTARDSAACGFAFEKNASYLVYAYEADGDLHTNLCSRSAPLGQAGEDMAALGPGTAPVPPQVPTRWPVVAAGVALVFAGGLLILRRRRAAG